MMNKTANPTSRDLHQLVKRHVTTNFLLERYNMSSQEELFNAIREVTPGEYQWFIREIRKADKLSSKRCSKKPEVEQSSEVAKSIDEESSVSVEAEFDAPEIATASVGFIVTSSEAFKKLQQEEHTMSTELISLEVSHEKLRTERHALVIELKDVRKKLDHLFETIAKCKISATEIISNYQQKAEEMAVLTQDIRERKKKLDELRKLIQESSKVIVFVYADGDIEIESPFEDTPTVADSDIDLVPFISEHIDVVQNLNLKQIAALVRLEKLLQKLLSLGISHEVIFDDSTMQEAFNSCCCETA